MNISKLYKIELSTEENKSVYALGETATINVSVTDYNNNPVQYTNIVLRLVNEKNKGVKNITVTTDKDGMASVTHTSATPQQYLVECANQRIYLKHDGWYLHSTNGSKQSYCVKLYYSLNFVKVLFNGSVAVNGSWKSLMKITDESLRPYMPVVSMVNYGSIIYCTVRDTGECMVKDVRGKSWTPNLNAEIMYIRYNQF